MLSGLKKRGSSKNCIIRTSFYKFYYDGGDDSDEEVEEVICALEYLELPANMFKKQERIVIEKLSPRRNL